MYQQHGSRGLSETINGYTPKGLNPAQWVTVREFVVDAVSRGNPADVTQARLWMSDAARLATWAHCVAGHPLTIEAVFDPDLISEWAELACTDVQPIVAVGRRGRMRRLAAVINPHAGLVVADKPFARGWTPNPYTPEEVLQLEGWATGQRTLRRRRHAAVFLGLTLGAGLQAGEIARLRAAEVTCDAGGVLIQVSGERARTVPVRARYEEPFRQLVENIDPDDYVFVPGRTRNSAAVVADFLTDSTAGSMIRPNPPRLRATWIIGLIQCGVPVRAVMQAAGLSRVNYFRAWLEAVPGQSPEQVRAWMRAGRIKVP